MIVWRQPRDDSAHTPDAILDGAKPLGCLLRFNDWALLETPAFSQALRAIHQTIEDSSHQLARVFTGYALPPPRWQRYPLLPPEQILANISDLGLSSETRAGLATLARVLRRTTPSLMDFFKRHPDFRTRHLTLNMPCYSLNIHAPQLNHSDRPLLAAEEILLAIQPKLFSPIGGAGLLYLNGIPSVHIVRGKGYYSTDAWRQRARLQSEFAAYNQAAESSAELAISCHRFVDCETGWSQL